jgi:hypothetical protein
MYVIDSCIDNQGLLLDCKRKSDLETTPEVTHVRNTPFQKSEYRSPSATHTSDGINRIKANTISAIKNGEHLNANLEQTSHSFFVPYTRKTLAQDLLNHLPEKWDYMSDIGLLGQLDESEFIEHCWVAYEKSYLSKGDMAIGRGNHLIWADLYNKVGNMSDDHYLNTDNERHGNVLKMDRWSLILNDCWILGGIHRDATFRVVSKIEPKQLLNPNTKQLTVTAREMLGLDHFGYQYQQAGMYKLFKPSELPVYKRPNVADYANYISTKEQSSEATVKIFIDSLKHQS